MTATSAAARRPRPSGERSAWTGEDAGRVAIRHVVVAELLCQAVDVHAGERVLDVAAGSGNGALAAARREARVTAVDLSAGALELARRRAELEALSVDTRVCDAQALPFEDASFDAVLSTFGAMFAADARRAADEMLRVCRPGGRIGLANWTPDGFVGGTLALLRRHAAPSEAAGLGDPATWGLRGGLRRLLGDEVDTLRTRRLSSDLRSASAAAHVEAIRSGPGAARLVFALLDETAQARLTRELTTRAEQHNIAGDGTFAAAAQYLQAVAVRSCAGRS